jgi:predicted PurR-regulated permease PerM
VSLAIIAATCLVVMGAVIVLVVLIARTLRRLHEAIATVTSAMTGVLGRVHTTVERADRMMDVVTDASASLQLTMTNIDRIRKTADKAAREVIAPLVGVYTALSSLVPSSLGDSHRQRRSERRPPPTDWTPP